MSVTFELLEEFTGTRIVDTVNDEGDIEATDKTQQNIKDIKVRFTCEDSGCTHERSVNVVFDAEGAYDHEATLVRCEEVAIGVAHKMACGVISQPTE